jgi:hypothetical protein
MIWRNHKHTRLRIVRYHPQKPRRSALYSLSNITNTLYFITILIFIITFKLDAIICIFSRHLLILTSICAYQINIKQDEYDKHTQQEHKSFTISFHHNSVGYDIQSYRSETIWHKPNTTNGNIIINITLISSFNLASAEYQQNRLS